jgi:hypothetical protein
MLALISLRNFAQSGHIGSFRSIVGDAAVLIHDFRSIPASLEPMGGAIALDGHHRRRSSSDTSCFKVQEGQGAEQPYSAAKRPQ